MQCIIGSKNLTLTEEAKDNPQWRVERLYAVQTDMKSQSGIYMTIGKVARRISTFKQKTNAITAT